METTVEKQRYLAQQIDNDVPAAVHLVTHIAELCLDSLRKSIPPGVSQFHLREAIRYTTNINFPDNFFDPYLKFLTNFAAIYENSEVPIEELLELYSRTMTFIEAHPNRIGRRHLNSHKHQPLTKEGEKEEAIIVDQKDIEDMISGLECLMTSSKYAYDTCGFVDHKGNPLNPDLGSTRYCHEEGVREAKRIIEVLLRMKSLGPIEVEKIA